MARVRSERNPRVAFFALLMVVFCILALIAYFVVEIRKNAAIVRLSGQEIVERTAPFIESLVDRRRGDPGTDASRYFAAIRCSSGVCAPEITGELPTLSWRLYALAALYASTKDEAKRAQIKADGKLTYGALKAIAENNWFEGDDTPFYTVDQVYEAWKILGDSELLYYVYRYGLEAMRWVRDHENEESIMEKGTMLSSMLVKTLYDMHMVLSEDAVIKSGTEEVDSEVSQKRDDDDSLKQMERVRNAVDEYLNLQPIIFKESLVEYRYLSCWGWWSRYWVAKAKRDGDEMKLLRSIMQNMRFDSRPYEAFQFRTVHDVMPCIEVLRELGEDDPEFKELEYAATQRFIVDRWDSKDRKLCNGQNSFLAASPYYGCEESLELIAASSWPLRVLSRHGEGDELYGISKAKSR